MAATTPMARRWPASRPGKPGCGALPGGPRHGPCAWAGRVAVRFFSHKAMPGTPMGRSFPRAQWLSRIRSLSSTGWKLLSLHRGRLGWCSDSHPGCRRWRGGFGYGSGKGRCFVPGHALSTGLLGRCDALASRRPSVAPPAWSRGGSQGMAATTPMARRRPASRPGKQGVARPPGEPGQDFVRGGGVAGRSLPAQRRPGTPRGRGFPRVLNRSGGSLFSADFGQVGVG